MANNTVGELKIKLSFDSNGLTTSQKETEAKLSKWSTLTGKNNGNLFGNAWTVAFGNVISKGLSTVTSAISSSMNAAINRVDTLNNFPKVMQSLGYSADASSSSVKKLSDRIDGLPTSLNDIVSNVQMLTASMGNLDDGMVNATTVGIALNDMFLAGGQGAEAASRAFTQYNQILAKGKVDMQSWNTLVEVAPGQMAQLAKELLGASANQKDLYEALQEGTISFDQMNAAMIKLDNEGGDGFNSWAQQAKDNTGGIGTAFENVQNRIAKAIQKIIDHIGSEKIADAINSISAGFSGIADVVIGIIDFLQENEWIVQLIGVAVAVITALSVAIWAVNAAMMANPITWIILAIGLAIAAITVLITHIQEVGDFIMSVFGAVGEFIGQVWQGIVDIFSGIGEFFGQVFQNAFDIITGIFGGIVNFYKGIWDGIVSLFGTIGQAIGDAVSGAFKAVVNGVLGFIEGIINTVIGGINLAIDLINAIPGVEIGKITPVDFPRLAEGGVATGSTIANIGEAGKEVVLPLEHNTDNWSGLLASTLADELEQDNAGIGGGLTIENMSFNIDNELDAREIGRVMMESIRRAAA